jgi:hypothetical protein
MSTFGQFLAIVCLSLLKFLHKYCMSYQNIVLVSLPQTACVGHIIRFSVVWPGTKSVLKNHRGSQCVKMAISSSSTAIVLDYFHSCYIYYVN